MRCKRLLLILAVTAAASMARGDHLADLYVLPAAAHTPGALGTNWRTDVSIHNIDSSPLTVQFLFVRSGEANPENIENLVSTALPTGSAVVPSRGTVIVRDVLAGLGGSSEALTGAIIISADRPFAATSRTYNLVGAGTIGQAVPAVRDFIENTIGDTNNTTAVAYVPGLISNVAFRTNLGFLAGAGSSGIALQITVRNAAGDSIGQKTYSLPAGSFTHLQVPVGSIAPGTFDAGTAEFRITSGDGTVASYASVVDNTSSDAVFIVGVFPPNAPFSKLGDSMFERMLRGMFR